MRNGSDCDRPQLVKYMNNQWSPSSWRSKPLAQRVVYPDQKALNQVLIKLSKLPPLVTSWEVEKLRSQLAEVASGDRFLLQGGDFAEEFDDCESSAIANKLKILLQMSLVLVYGCRKRVVNVGRFAGQYAKPRSSDTETRDGVTLPSYRGCNINRREFAKESRTPNPELLLRGHECSAMTLNFIRALVDGGFTDLHHPEYWDIDFFAQSPQAREYRKIVDSISNSVHFMESITGHHIAALNRAEFFTSHEALHLPFEQARTRRVPRRSVWYNVSTHLPWIGDRTRSPQGAHVEYCRGIANPIGLKIGPSITPDELIELTELLNPANEPGRLTLIHRFGVDKVAAHLPQLIEEVRRKGKIVLWCCDPMHGNTIMSQSGLKTRSFDDILDELEQVFAIHEELGTIMGGVHFELTGDHVTECTGGARNLSDHDLQQAYKTQVDPRLNYEQALEMALRIARRMRRNRRRRVVGRPATGIVARRENETYFSLDNGFPSNPSQLGGQS